MREGFCMTDPTQVSAAAAWGVVTLKAVCLLFDATFPLSNGCIAVRRLGA